MNRKFFFFPGPGLILFVSVGLFISLLNFNPLNDYRFYGYAGGECYNAHPVLPGSVSGEDAPFSGKGRLVPSGFEEGNLIVLGTVVSRPQPAEREQAAENSPDAAAVFVKFEIVETFFGKSEKKVVSVYQKKDEKPLAYRSCAVVTLKAGTGEAKDGYDTWQGNDSVFEVVGTKVYPYSRLPALAKYQGCSLQLLVHDLLASVQIEEYVQGLVAEAAARCVQTGEPFPLRLTPPALEDAYPTIAQWEAEHGFITFAHP